MKYILLITATALISLSGCRMMSNHSERGDGNWVTQTRNLTDFDEVEVSSAIDLYITQDSGYSVKVEADQNLQEFLETSVSGRRLSIHQRNNTNLDPSREIKVYVSAPLYRELHASGACSIIGKNKLSGNQDLDIDLSGSCDVDIDVKAPKISVGMSGASSAKLKGETRDLDVDGSGSTDFKAFELLTENAHIEMSGAGDAQVYASVTLDVNTSGSSSIEYKGAAKVSSDISGAGSVKKVD